MALVKRTNELFPRIPSFFDDFLGRDLSDWLTTGSLYRESSVPAANIKETDKDFTVELAAPGMEKKDFNIEMENNVMKISSEKKDEIEEKDEDGNYFRKEFSYHSFQRSFRIPENVVNVDKIQANYKDGVLSIRLPKLDEKVTKPTRQIKIS
jgi:HSP20 family protein